MRPPRTWADQRARLAKPGTPGAPSLVIATSLDELAKNKESVLKLQAVDEKERQQFSAHEKAIEQHRTQRHGLEVQSPPPPTDANSKPPVASRRMKDKLPASPIVASPTEHLDKDRAPPKQHQSPPPDLKVTPKARGAAGKSKSVPGEPGSTPNSPRAGAPKPEPKGKPMREPPSAPPGRTPGKPQRAPQGKPDLEPKNAPKQ